MLVVCAVVCTYEGTREELQRLRNDHHHQLDRNKQELEAVSGIKL